MGNDHICPVCGKPFAIHRRGKDDKLICRKETWAAIDAANARAGDLEMGWGEPLFGGDRRSFKERFREAHLMNDSSEDGELYEMLRMRRHHGERPIDATHGRRRRWSELAE